MKHRWPRTSKRVSATIYWGNNPNNWHTGIANFGQVRYPEVYPGIDLVFYGNHRRLEHDFVLQPHADYRQIRIQLDGADDLVVNADGSLLVRTKKSDLEFQPPDIYQLDGTRKLNVHGRYRVISTNEFAFEVQAFDRERTLVIDPVLAFSTYLAGSRTDEGTAIAVDAAGSAYITGLTTSADFPTLNALQGVCTSSCGQADVFVTKLNPSGSALVYSTFIGGSANDQANAIAVDSAGNAVVAGFTSSFDFPLKNASTAILSAFSNHGFAFSLDSTGSAFNFSTYLGGEASDAATGIATDPSGAVYVSGYTTSINFPVTPGNQIGPAPTFSADLFLTKFTANGTVAFSTLIGGNSNNFFFGTFGNTPPNPISVAVDSSGQAVMTGLAFSGFPTTPGTFQPNYPGAATGTSNAFVGKLNSAGDAILFGTYLGGTGGDGATAVTLDSAANVFVTGTTFSLDFPTTVGAFQASNLQGGGSVSFVSKLDPTLSTLAYSTYLGPTSATFGNIAATGIAVDSKGNTFIIGNTSSPQFPLVSPIVSALPQNFFFSSAAFVSELNPAGSALTFSTYFSGSVGTNGAGVAVDGSGGLYLTGSTQDPDLPTTPTAFQTTIPIAQQNLHIFVTKVNPGIATAGVCLTPGSVAFGAFEPGQISPPFSLVIKNCGTVTLKVSKVASTNPIFTVTQNTCAAVAVGATCVIKYAILQSSPMASIKALCRSATTLPSHKQTFL